MERTEKKTYNLNFVYGKDTEWIINIIRKSCILLSLFEQSNLFSLIKKYSYNKSIRGRLGKRKTGVKGMILRNGYLMK